MDTQQPHPDGYAKLNDTDETNPNVQFSLEQKDSEELNARHRTSASGNEAPSSGSATQDHLKASSQPQRKELSTLFSFFYGAVLVFYTLLSGFSILGMIGSGSQGLGFDKFDFFVEGWLLVQCLVAFIGLWKKDLGKIEKAFTMVKIYFPLVIISNLGGLFEAIALQQKSRTRGGNPVYDILVVGIVDLVLLALLIFLPTRMVRNTLKVTPEEEEMRKENAQEIDPIEQLDSLKFTIFKYVLLISFCLDIKGLVSGVYDDFADLPKFLEKVISEVDFFTTEISGYIVFPLSLIATFFAFEGLRRKNLEKILTSIKLMKVHLVVRVVFIYLSAIAGYFEGTLKERYQNMGATVDIENQWMLLFYFLFVGLLISFVTYVFIHFASQIRDILKAHQKAKHTL